MREPAELSTTQCLELLERKKIGRVAFATPMGPRIVPVPYTLEGSDILFRVPPFSELGTYGRDCELAFEVDEIDLVGHSGSSVVARGDAEVVEESDDGTTAPPGAGRPGVRVRRMTCIRLRTQELTGRRVGPELLACVDAGK